MHAWLVHHPPTTRHPGAVLAFTDPTLTDGSASIDMPCWVIGCDCDAAFPPVSVPVDDAVNAFLQLRDQIDGADRIDVPSGSGS